MPAPLISGRLDNDLYAFTMSQFAWRNFQGVKVRYRFINRSGVPLGRYLDAPRLREAIDRIRYMQLSPRERHYLRKLGMFDPGYLKWIDLIVLPKVEFRIRGDLLELEYEGEWASMILFETPLLAAINQLVMEARISEAGYTPQQAWAEADRRLTEKIAFLAAHPGLKVTLFGSRRRLSREWEEHLHRRLLAEAPDSVAATANLDFARRFGIKPDGTMAHQLFMVTTALQEAAGAADPIGAAQDQVLDLWEKEYGEFNDGQLLVPLTDTYGTPAFLARLTPERALRLTGFRQDSGDPFQVGRLYLDYWRRNRIDARTKGIVFSDGLDLQKAAMLAAQFREVGREGFGIGGFLANDTVVPPVSIVIKPVAADGHPTVKLSDNLAKATGDPATVARMKRIAGYTATFKEAPVR